MSISKRDIKLMLILFGIVLFLICYFTVYDAKSQKNEMISMEIDKYKIELEELKLLVAKVDKNKEIIAKSKDSILKAQSKYPSGIKSEDLIMFVVELEEKIGISSDGISFIQPVEIMELKKLVPSKNDYKFGEAKVYRTSIGINCDLSYQQLKDLTEYIYSQKENTSLESISVSYNATTGLLYSNIVINKFFIYSESGEPPYVKPNITGVGIGQPNPFNTVYTNPGESEVNNNEGDAE